MSKDEGFQKREAAVEGGMPKGEIEKERIAIMGDEDSILGFKALGISAFPVEDSKKGEDTLKKIYKEDFVLIFITESIAKGLLVLMEELSKERFPLITIIPDKGGSQGVAYASLRLLAKEAVGIDILKEF